MIKYRPMLELTGHPSDLLIKELEGGKIKDIVLLKSHAMAQFGAQSWLKSSESTIRLKATSPNLAQRVIDGVRSALHDPEARSYHTARVKFEKPDKTVDTVTFDNATGNLIDDKDFKPPKDGYRVWADRMRPAPEIKFPRLEG